MTKLNFFFTSSLLWEEMLNKRKKNKYKQKQEKVNLWFVERAGIPNDRMGKSEEKKKWNEMNHQLELIYDARREMKNIN